MAYLERDAAVSLQDETFHEVEALSATRHALLIDEDGAETPLELPGPTVGVRLAVDGRGRRYLSVDDAVDPVTWLWREGESALRVDGKRGRGWSAVRPLAQGCELYLQRLYPDGANETFIDVYSGETGEWLREFPCAASSMGIHQILGPTAVLMDSERARLTRLVAGVQFTLATEIQGFLVGQVSGSINGSVGLVGPDGAVLMTKPTPAWSGYTNVAPRLAARPGAARIAATGENTPRARDQVLIPYDPMPPIVVPATLRPRWRGCLGGAAGVPGNLGGGDDLTRPIVEGTGTYKDGRPWIPPAHESRWAIVFSSPLECTDLEVEFAEVAAACRRSGAAAGVYSDRPWFHETCWDFCARLRAAGVAVIPIVRAYPSGPTDSEDALEGRTWLNVQDLKKGRDGTPGFDVIGVCSAIYDQSGYWPLPMVARSRNRLTESLEQGSMHAVEVEIFFGWDRVPVRPWLQEHTRVVCDRTATPTTSLPRTAVVVVPPKPIPRDARPSGQGGGKKPTPPNTESGKLSGADKTAIAAGASLGFLAWLGKKLKWW